MPNSQSLPEDNRSDQPNEDNLKKIKQLLHIKDKTFDDNKILLVYERLEEFVQYFVREFETKLNTYFMVIENCKQKAGKYPDNLAATLGQGGGAITGLLLGSLFGQPLPGATYGGKLGKFGGRKLGQKLGTEHHEKNVAKAMNLVLMYHNDKPGMRKLLVESGFDIFQSFEMQFVSVTGKEFGSQQAMRLLARDATDRAINSCSAGHHTISESVVLGQSKRGFIKIKSFGFDIVYKPRVENTDVDNKWKTASLYGKAGLIRQEDNTIVYYKNNDSKTEKYGYRRPLKWENGEKLYEGYDIDSTDENNRHFKNYAYVLNVNNSKEISASLLEEINLQDEDLSEERLTQVFKDNKSEIVQALSSVIEQTSHVTNNHNLLQKMITEIESFTFKKYIEGMKKMRECLERVERKSEIYAEEDRIGHTKTQDSIEDGKQTLSKIFEENVYQTLLMEKFTTEVFGKWEGAFDTSKPVIFFTGREQQLKEIADNIQKGVVVICGLSGMGKTQLALRYADSEYNEGNSIVSIDATTRDMAQRSFRTFAQDQLQQKIKGGDGEYKSLKSIVTDVYEYFSNGRCLFIFHNAEKYSSLEEFLPFWVRGDPSKYFILITSNNNLEWKGPYTRIKVLLPLNGFTKPESMEFLKKTIDTKEDEIDDESIGRLAEKLHNVPLFLKHIAEYINADIVNQKKRQSKFNVHEYITLFDAENKTNEEICSRIWEVTLRKLEDKSAEVGGELAIRMAHLIAYFESKNIPEELFSSLADENLKKIHDGTACLEKYCIVSVSDAMLSVHGLIQEVIRLKEKPREKDILEKGLKLIGTRMASKKCIKGYIPHIISLWKYASKNVTLIKRFIVDYKSTFKVHSLKEHSTYFHLIAESSSDAVVKTILDSIEKYCGDNLPSVINAKARNGKTALHYAIRGENESTIKLLIQKGADVNAGDVSCHTPLHLAARYGLNSAVEALLEGHAQIDPETSDNFKFTPLHLAAQNGHEEVVSALLKKGAEVNARTQYKFTSLQLASENGHLGVVKLLLDQKRIDIENKNGYKLTALHLAAQKGHKGVVQLLLYKNADINASDDGKFTPLHIAALNGFVEVVNELLADSKVNVDATTTQGNTPLHLALENDRITIAQALIDRNAKSDILNIKGRTASDLLTEKGLADELKQNKNTETKQTKQESKFDKTFNRIDGQIYEIRLLEWLLLKGLSEDVYRFNLASNMEKAHPLDDIVFKCRHAKEQNEMLIFLQAKHREYPKESASGKTKEKNKVNINKLFSMPKNDSNAKKADFSLVKYFDSFLKIKQQFSDRKISDHIFNNEYKNLACDVILYTNAAADFGEGGKKGLIKGINKIRIEPDHILNISNTEKHYYYYQIVRGENKILDEKINILKEVSEKEEDITEFLNKLKLFLGQPDHNDLGQIIKEKIRKDYRIGEQSIDSVFSEFEGSILTWWNEDNKYLTKYTRFLHDALRISYKFNVKEPVVPFIGRKAELDELHKALQEQVKVVLTQNSPLDGVGGIGKTQMARMYVNCYSKDYDQNILCVDATNNLTLEECFRRLNLKIKCNDRNMGDSSLDIIISEVYNFFVDRNRKSLFIFDNATAYKQTDTAIDSADLLKFLPTTDNSTSAYDKPRILIISADRDWGQIELFPLDVFTESDAIEFINTNVKYECEANEVKNLAQQLKRFPLALQYALAYINQENRSSKLWNTKMLTIGDYLSVYEEKLCPRSSDISEATFKTLAVTIDKIEAKRDGKAALHMLNVMGYLPASDVNIDHIFGKLIENQEERHGAVELLSQYALLSLQCGVLEMDRFMQQIIRVRLEEQSLHEETAKQTYKLLAENFTLTELESYIRKNNLLKHFESVI